MAQTQAAGKVVRIGGASGFWGDSVLGPVQLVDSGQIDYLVFDYLAETTMALLAAAHAKRPELGYATDFVDSALPAVLPALMRQGIKVVANAGGIHPQGCAAAVQALAASMADQLPRQPRVAVVLGDDVLPQLPALRSSGVCSASGQPLPERLASANAYLGARGVAQALALGADIVITGRVVDSAVTLGPLMHEFGWTDTDWDRLAGGSLAGHIIECGCQATGGLHTDWQSVPDWPHMGYPIVQCSGDGSFVLTKAKGTGGLVHPAAVAEQLLYEIGDPGAYQLPDVCCDFRAVQLQALGADRVRVSGARGRAPGGQLKVSATQLLGYRSAGMLVLVGEDAAAKARRTGDAILARSRELLAARGLPPFTHTAVQVLGDESLYGPHSRARDAREVLLRVVADHPDKRALELFAREIAPAGTSWAPGTTGPGLGRPSPSPLIGPLAFFIDKAQVPVTVAMDGQTHAVHWTPSPATPPAAPLPEPVAWHASGPTRRVPLHRLAWARSGDKGNTANIGVVARQPDWLPLLWAQLTPQAVHAHLAHLVQGPVTRHHLPGIHAINLVLEQALDGGGPVSTRMDPLGKGMGQILLAMELDVPVDWVV
jgi:hypothetical protein